MFRLSALLLLFFLSSFCKGIHAQEVIYSPSSLGSLKVTTVVKNLANPWGMAFLPDGRILITERPGRLRIYSQGQISPAITGTPAVYNQGQGGLLDVAIDPNFRQNQWIYLTYAEAGSGGVAGTAVMRGKLSGNTLLETQVLFRQLPKLSTGNHFGSRLVFDGSGYLFVTLGENNNRITSQYLDHHQGKIIRIWPDGSIPNDNPFIGQTNAKPEIWSYGHRNPQGATLNPWTGKLWMNEHGPMGGDEINIPQAGKNYGWPIITYGIDYNGQPIPESTGTSAPGMEQPVHYWVPSIAPSGMAFYDGNKNSAWYGNLFVGGLVAQQLVRLEVNGEAITREERLLSELGYRIRAVKAGPDGGLYLLTDSASGMLLKIDPPPKEVRRSIKPPRPRPQ
ncbi:MAG TPA: PQQ-dependent sugar dehydrogenase [Arenimonas sp.]|nr:PQQ-dependent sugar dehydrogenase [Arenimonas sp.]HPO25251.1 PQQ-dependent sugar dehydrogenase [Arenimonas sp.]HPW31336.1 PQQ-dependent sugar dehydrogenase [Arenimonas sp.]